MFLKLLLSISLLVVASCTFNTPRPKNELTLANQTAIMGGTVVKKATRIASGIVSVYDVKDHAICTGSIISEKFILTAAHCALTKKQNVKIVFGLDADETMSIREPDVRQVYVRNVSGIAVHPNYDQSQQQTEETDWSDIAIMKFEGGLPPGFQPVKMLEDKSLLKAGVEVRLAGYGVSDIEFSPVDPKKVRHFEEALEFGEIICDNGQKNCMSVDMSGDGILRETTAPISIVYDSEVQLDESKGRGTCSGDSGGPAYLEKEGELYLFGITSRGSAVCDAVGVYTNAVVFKDWIAQTISKMK